MAATKRLSLPDAVQLHEHARRSAPRLGNDPPAAFVQSRERIAELERSLEAEREHMRGLILEAYRQGVQQNTLARWSGYTVRWVSMVLGGGS